MTQNASLESIFTEAVRITSLLDRSEFLHDACGNDSELRGRVDALLQAHDEAGSFLDHPVARIAPGEQIDEDTSRDLSATHVEPEGLVSLAFLPLWRVTLLGLAILWLHYFGLF